MGSPSRFNLKTGVLCTSVVYECVVGRDAQARTASLTGGGGIALANLEVLLCDLSYDDQIDALNELAGRAVYGRETAIGFGWTHADWWMRYQRAIPPIMTRLQEESA